MSRALVLGAGGQLGRELVRGAPDGVECLALDRGAVDVADLDSVMATVDAHRPAVIVNAAAYTAVDGAESEPERARAVNARGVENVAKAAMAAQARVVHVSTDYVFDGTTAQAYRPGDVANPLGAYGMSKLLGEIGLWEVAAGHAVVVRTSALYSVFGGNFVKTMLGRMAKGEAVRVVADQLMSPTWARRLAEVLWRLAAEPRASGVFHWTDGGDCSWHEFAQAIHEEGRALGLLDREARILPVTTADYGAPAPRPAYSVLDSSGTREALGLRQRPWREQLRAMLHELREARQP